MKTSHNTQYILCLHKSSPVFVNYKKIKHTNDIRVDLNHRHITKYFGQPFSQTKQKRTHKITYYLYLYEKTAL